MAARPDKETRAAIELVGRLVLAEARCVALEQHVEELKAIIAAQDRRAEDFLARLTAMTEAA